MLITFFNKKKLELTIVTRIFEAEQFGISYNSYIL